MVIETAMSSFGEWFRDGLTSWLIIVAGVTVLAVSVGWLIGALRQGPVTALRATVRTLATGVVDLLRISPRRVAALGWLAVKESIRRRVVVVFAVFILILLFAGWYLDPASTHPDRLYLSFVLTATSYLVLLLALFLSALSLPGDIKNKTLHTVVTKPVRPSEIVLGRILGFTAIGTFLLVLMGIISYVFVVRGLSHTHPLVEDDLAVVERPDGTESSMRQGTTKAVHKHHHQVFVDASGKGEVKPEHGHRHELVIRKSGNKTTYRLGPPRGLLQARVPIYGKLRFKDSEGRDAERGVNVGDEWAYRSFIRGGSLAAAIWTFDGITESNFPKQQFPRGLPLEMTLEVFRTTKGETDDPKDIPAMPGSLAIRNPKSNDKPIEIKIFRARDFSTEVEYIPFEVETPEGRKLDLFSDLAPDGQLEVQVQSIQPMQYFGMAQADVYFRARDASFALNFAKGYVGIWLQMVLLIGIGVTFSTFLSGPIALVATLGTLVGGFFSGFMGELGAGKVVGGGPVEALVRLLTQQNLVSEMNPGMRTRAAEMIDNVLEYALAAIAAILPNFGEFSFANHVAYGFDVSPDALLRCVLQALAFLLPVFVAGYFFLKMREVAK